MYDLFIENYRADIREDLSALLTFAIDDVKDFSSRNTAFSKTIVLPGTARNNALFGNIFDFNNGNFYDETKTNIAYNFNAAKSAAAIIFQDNIQIFKGVIRIMSIVIDRGFIEYEVAVFGELGGLVSALGNNRLQDLDFSAYDMTYSIANIVASWDNAPGSGVYFPLIDYGNYSTNKHSWQYKTFRPALYVKEYIDKMFTAAGYTYTCDLFGTDRFKKLVVPHGQKALVAYRSSILTAERHTNITQVDIPDGVASDVLYRFESYVSSIFTDTGSLQGFKYTDTPVITTNLSVRLKGTYTSTTPFTINFLKNLDVVDTQILPASLSGTFDITLAGTNIGFVTNDLIQIEIVNDGDGSSAYSLDSDFAALQVGTSAAIPTPVSLGDTIQMNDCTPQNVLQKDFLSSIVKLFNLYIYEDKWNEKQLIMSPYVDFYNPDPATANAWTQKLDHSQPITIKPMSELNSRYYEFKFKEDSDYWNDLYQKRYNQNYGDYLFDSEFEFANEKETAQLIFSGTPIVGYNGEDKVYSTIFKRSGTTTIVEENIDSNIRILQTKKVTGVTSYNVLNGATVLGSYTAYGYAGHLDDPDAPSNDIQFGVPQELFFVLLSGALNVNQFNVYWSPYMAEITDKDSKLLTATFRLNTRDIFNLDFSKFIYLDGSLWRLIKIEDYNATLEDTCKVTLLKVINTTY